jgi:hypothetical protein
MTQLVLPPHECVAEPLHSITDPPAAEFAAEPLHSTTKATAEPLHSASNPAAALTETSCLLII